MFRGVIHILALLCLAIGSSSRVVAAEHNTGSSTTNGASSSTANNTDSSTTKGDNTDEKSLKDRLSDLTKDPVAADPDKLNKISAELDQHEKDSTMTEEEIQEARIQIESIRKIQGVYSGDGSIAGSYSGDLGSKGPSGLTSVDRGFNGSTGNSSPSAPRSGLTGGEQNSRWGTFAATIMTKSPAMADTGTKLMQQPPPSSNNSGMSYVPMAMPAAGSSQPQQQSSGSGPGSPPTSQSMPSFGTNSGGASVGSTPTITGSNLALVQPALTSPSEFFSSSTGPSTSSMPVVVNESRNTDTGSTGGSYNIQTAAPLPERNTRTTDTPLNSIGNSNTPATSVPKTILDTRLSTVRTAQSADQIEVNRNFTFTDTPTYNFPPPSQVFAKSVVLSKTQTPVTATTANNMRDSSDTVYRVGLQKSSTVFSNDDMVDRITSEYAQGKGVDAQLEERPVAQRIFARSIASLDQMTAMKAVNPPSIDAKLTRGFKESSGLKGGTSVEALTGKVAVVSTVPATAIRGALGIISLPK